MHKLLFKASFLAAIAFTQSSMAQESLAPPSSTVIILPFHDGGSKFRPNTEQATDLSDAKQATLVAIRGRTSANTPSAKDEALALSRALSVRSYLIAHGVSPLKISINFASAVDFMTENSSQEGRRENQRVEVELVYASPLHFAVLEDCGASFIDCAKTEKIRTRPVGQEIAITKLPPPEKLAKVASTHPPVPTSITTPVIATQKSTSAATNILSPDSDDLQKKIQKWDVLASDVRLATTFERWAQKAGWRVQWDAAKHFLIDGTSTFTGSFEDAVKAALMTPGIRLGAYPLEACVYNNTPPLLRITRQGEQTQECAD